MKAKLLFIMNDLGCGGAEKALVSLLDVIDYSAFDVDLYLFKKEGLFLKQLNPHVNILPSPEVYPYFDMSLRKAIISNLKAGKWSVVYNRIMIGFIYKTEKIPAVREQKSWKYISRVLDRLPGNYDAAIGFLEKRPNYFCADKVNAKIKIGFFHSDYDKLRMNSKIETLYLRKLTKIFTISTTCKAVLQTNFPDIRDKFRVMHNIISPNTIKKLGSEPVKFKGDGIKIASVGRLGYEKGFDMAVEACKILVDKGHDILWYVIGDGGERAKLEQLIQKYGLQRNFFILGFRDNPYPYIVNSDIYVQPSRFEGKSIAIDEAKILAKPIVVTNFPSVVDQITHLENGYIVQGNPDSIAMGIEELVNNESLRRKIVDNLAKEVLGTEEEITKLYEAIK